MTPLSESLLQELSRSDFFRKVSDICNAVNAVRDSHQLFDLSLQKIMELFGAGRGSIFILSGDDRLILKVAYGMDRIEKEKLEKRMGEGIVGQVARMKQPVVVTDINSDKRFGHLKHRNSYRTPSFICAPLLLKDQLIGVINLADKHLGRFDQNDLQLLDFLTSQMALNYRRIELYEKFKNIVHETQTLKNKLGEKHAEAQTLQKQIHLQEKFATIGKLAGGIAHEFNNPLDGVMRYTNLCLEHMNGEDVVRGYLLEIKQGLNRMAGIVRNLLACSRNEFPERGEVDFRQALDYSLKNLQTEVLQKNITIIKNIATDIPLFADQGLERVLANLLRNAIDATPDDGKITITALYQDDILEFKIADTGHGIPQQDLDKIFEPFFTTKDIGKGCGLGLTVVAEIVKSYEGKINVESTLDKGTTFTVQLPLKMKGPL